MSKLSETLKVSSGNYALPFMVSGLLLVGFVLALRFNDHKHATRIVLRGSSAGLQR